MEYKYIFSKFKNTAVIALNKTNEIIYENDFSTRYTYYYDDIMAICKNHDEINFCFMNFPSEVTSFVYKDFKLILIDPLDNIVRMTKETESLQEIKQELNEVINSSFDGIVITDNKGNIIHQNPSYGEITGLSTKELIGRNLKDIEDEGIIDEAASLKALKLNQAVTIIQKINTGAMTLVSAVPIRDANGNIKKIVNNVRDLTKLNQLETEINKLKEKNQKVKDELAFLKQSNDAESSIIAHSQLMQEVLERALRVAHIDSSIIIQGDSGVGKEKIVDLIHQRSMRKDHPLIKVNCGAIPESLLESELFGYSGGAFTGANQKGKKGLFEAGHKGTIFLDEIGEMNKDLQVKLLRVLQEREITKVGDTKPIAIDVRIIAATHRNLEEMVEKGDFREDLYYRLNVIPIHIPPLSKRRDDIVPLVYHFLKEIKHKYDLTRTISNDALEIFKRQPWDGNVRELQNMVERIALMSSEPEITTKVIVNELKISPSITKENSDYNSFESIEPLKIKMEKIEADIIRKNIEAFPSVRKAALSLKVDQSTLVRKMKKYGINK